MHEVYLGAKHTTQKMIGEKMNTSSNLCTCDNSNCPLHPTKHDNGCTPCIMKNLKLKEVPNCFFHLLENANSRTGDSFVDFAKLVLR